MEATSLPVQMPAQDPGKQAVATCLADAEVQFVEKGKLIELGSAERDALCGFFQIVMTVCRYIEAQEDAKRLAAGQIPVVEMLLASAARAAPGVWNRIEYEDGAVRLRLFQDDDDNKDSFELTEDLEPDHIMQLAANRLVFGFLLAFQLTRMSRIDKTIDRMPGANVLHGFVLLRMSKVYRRADDYYLPPKVRDTPLHQLVTNGLQAASTLGPDRLVDAFAHYLHAVQNYAKSFEPSPEARFGDRFFQPIDPDSFPRDSSVLLRQTAAAGGASQGLPGYGTIRAYGQHILTVADDPLVYSHDVEGARIRFRSALREMFEGAIEDNHAVDEKMKRKRGISVNLRKRKREQPRGSRKSRK